MHLWQTYSVPSLNFNNTVNLRSNLPVGAMTKKVIAPTERKEKEQPEMHLHKMNSVTTVFSLSFRSAGKGQFLTGITVFF